MKPTILFTAIIFGFMLLACNKKETEATKPNADASNKLNSLERTYPDNYPFSSFIPIDSGNKMISSYLASIHSDMNDTDLRSFSINADTLREYLSDTRIRKVRIMLAHTLEYINEGNFGKPAGYVNGNIGFIVVGIDANGNYVYRNNNLVLDHMTQCPTNCDDVSSPLLTY